jgi:hypothetical protein
MAWRHVKARFIAEAEQLDMLRGIDVPLIEIKPDAASKLPTAVPETVAHAVIGRHLDRECRCPIRPS